MPIKNLKKKNQAQQRADAKRTGRTRNFATVVYPESAPDDWKQKLNELHVAILISPLHDNDIDPNGELKKPHYHVLMMFEGPKDFDTQVKPIFDEIGAVGREMVNSVRGYARYLCHLDNPEKAYYNPSDVVSMGGADYYAITNLPTDNRKMLADIIAFIQESKIYSFAEFIDVSRLHHPEWFTLVINSNGWIIKEFIKSLEWERAIGYIRVENRLEIDGETGEILND